MTRMDQLRKTSRLQNLVFDEAATWPREDRPAMADELRRLASLIADDDDEQEATLFGFAKENPQETK